MLEKKVENLLREGIKITGGMCIKINSQGNNGMPDRLVITPEKEVYFVELKRPKGGILSPVQIEQQKRLENLGQEVVNLSTEEEVKDFFKCVLTNESLDKLNLK